MITPQKMRCHRGTSSWAAMRGKEVDGRVGPEPVFAACWRKSEFTDQILVGGRRPRKERTHRVNDRQRFDPASARPACSATAASPLGTAQRHSTRSSNCSAPR